MLHSLAPTRKPTVAGNATAMPGVHACRTP